MREVRLGKRRIRGATRLLEEAFATQQKTLKGGLKVEEDAMAVTGKYDKARITDLWARSKMCLDAALALIHSFLQGSGVAMMEDESMLPSAICDSLGLEGREDWEAWEEKLRTLQRKSHNEPASGTEWRPKEEDE